MTLVLWHFWMRVLGGHETENDFDILFNMSKQ